MVKVHGKNKGFGKSSKQALSKAQEFIVKWANDGTLEYLKGVDNLLGLKDAKDKFKEMPNNPFNMVIDKRHSNAKVWNWIYSLCGENNGFNVKLENGSIQKQYLIDVSLNANRVGYFNPIFAQNEINKVKDKQQKARMEAKLKELLSLPRRY